ncbi:MAG: ComEA family DNA-binding protein [Myxococcota bacterium]
MQMYTSRSRSALRAAPVRALVLAALVAVAGVLVAATPSAGAATSPGAITASGSEGVVNINTADTDQLMLLPGIGPSLAQRVVEYRTHRRFKRAVELARVKGIGLKTVRKLKPWIRVKGRNTLTERPSAEAREAVDAPLRRVASLR